MEEKFVKNSFDMHKILKRHYCSTVSTLPQLCTNTTVALFQHYRSTVNAAANRIISESYRGISESNKVISESNKGISDNCRVISDR